jgi:PAS domain S-box-containing protein
VKYSNSATSSAKAGGNVNTNYSVALGETGLLDTVVDWWPKGYPDPEYRAWVVKTWHERVEKAKQTGTSFEPMEATLTCKDAALRTVIVSATNLWEPFEQFLSVTLYDITERKESERVLQESEQKFRTIIDASPVPQCLVDDKQNITFLNKAFTTIFGYTLEDIPTVVDWWPKGYPDPEYRAWVVKTWHERVEKAKQTGTPFEPMDVTVTCKDASLRTVIVSAINLWEPFEQFLSVTLYDITERKESERVLQESEEKFRTLFENATDGIFLLSSQGDIVTLNPAFACMHGYTLEEMLTMNLWIFEKLSGN